jgi:membrane protease YdiL (CAAX protease family)
MLELGTVGQRQRFIVLAAELAGPQEASERLAALERDLADPPSGDPPTLTREQERVQSILHRLYPPDTGPIDLGATIAALDEDDRRFLRDELEWFGELALVPVQAGDRPGREAILGPAGRVARTLIVGAIVGIGVGFLGFAGLITLLVLAVTGGVRSGLGLCHARDGLYAETFAVWGILFLLLQIAASLFGAFVPSFALLALVVGFFASLLALAWPVMRGVPWALVRQDIGWTLGAQPPLEPLIGVGGYLMALPLLAAGVLMTFLLMTIQAALGDAGPTFGPGGGPAHPVVTELAQGGFWLKAQILVLASVAAPIVEETMFRGVLYRHLRERTRALGSFASVVVAGAISSLIFAAIHPQGWVAIPALMSLAFAFVIVREWRGTVIPSMIVHAISNGIVMSLLLILLGA